MRDVDAQPIDKLASLDAQAVVGMMARYAVREHNRRGVPISADEARSRAIVALSDLIPEPMHRKGNP